jgi:transposase
MSDRSGKARGQVDEGARRHLSRLCWDGDRRFCPRCNAHHVYALRSGRHRCKQCHYTFSEFAGRWLSQSRLSCGDWLILVRLFEEEQPAARIAEQLGRAYATVFHGVTLLRACILAHGETSGPLLEGGVDKLKRVWTHRNHDALRVRDHAPVFGVHEHEGTVSVPVLPDIGPDYVLRLPVKKVRRGNLVYTGQVTLYDTLVFASSSGCGQRQNARFCRSPVYIDGTAGFWAYAARRLATHFGVSPEHFPLYLKELEFRYNHRQRELAPLLLRYLCDFMPRSPRATRGVCH